MHFGGSKTLAEKIIEDKKNITLGNIIGPNIIATGQILDGDPPVFNENVVIESPIAAKKKVIEIKSNGYDFIKIYNNYPLCI